MRASQRKFHIVYKTTCLITGRYYIGLHSTDNLDDGYLGSGRRLVRSVNKHGAENHQRIILEQLPTRLAASEKEIELLSPEVRKDPLCLNCGPGGLGATDRPATSDETRAKLSSVAMGVRKSKEHCESIRKSRIGVPTSSKSKNGKKWKVICPDGIELQIVSLYKWANENGVPYRRLYASKPTNGYLAIPDVG